MCEYDFDYYVDDLGLKPYGPGVGPKFCDCGHRPEPGEPVRAWMQLDDQSNWDSCPICEGEETLLVVDDYGCETDVERRCWRCGGEGAVGPDEDEMDRGYFCARCDAARELLDEWCDGMYSWGRIPDQIIEHWQEDELYRSTPFSLLVVMARRRWRWRGDTLIEVPAIKSLVGQALDAHR